jgi:hypothetical protein
MENGEILAVISKQDTSSGFAASPGNIIDLAPTRPGEDDLNEVFLFLNEEFPRQARYASVEIVASGDQQNPGVVRARGVDSKEPRIEIETEYVLATGERWITMTSRFTSNATTTIANYRVGDAVQWGRTRGFAPGHGFDLAGRRVRVDWVAGLGQRTSYAMVPDGQRPFETTSGSTWSDSTGAVFTLQPAGPSTLRVTWSWVAATRHRWPMRLLGSVANEPVASMARCATLMHPSSTPRYRSSTRTEQ